MCVATKQYQSVSKGKAHSVVCSLSTEAALKILQLSVDYIFISFREVAILTLNVALRSATFKVRTHKRH